MQLSCIMQLQGRTWPARYSVANTLFLYPRKHFMIMISFTAPATLHELKWDRNVFYIVGMLEDQCTTLKEDGYTRRYGKIKRLYSTHSCNYILRSSTWKGKAQE